MAACPQLPYELIRELQAAELDQRQPSREIDILTISDNPTLSVYLSSLFQKSGWALARTRTWAEGISFLERNRAAVVVCEESLPDGFWHDLAVALSSLPDAPALVVVGDDHSLVHEVLALGGFDVLVRPLRESDVVWTIASAWHAWMKRFGVGGTSAP
jgi:DNA-binding NtrC family response regulator